MKISDLIKKLEEAKEEHGDLDVFARNRGYFADDVLVQIDEDFTLKDIAVGDPIELCDGGFMRVEKDQTVLIVAEVADHP